jgi:hypothetical protein
VKIVALWLAALTIAISCSVNHRSGEFTCTTSRDCADGRVCTDGLCVLVNPPLDGGDGDGGLPGGACPANCTSCDSGTHTCRIDCVNNDVCRRPITCAQGWNCMINCLDDDSCRAGIDCRQAASCNVACLGDTTCRNATCGDGNCTFTCNGTGSCSGIACGTGACSVMCNGTDSCHDANGGAGLGVNCANACACDVECSFDSTCAPVVCRPTCDDLIDGCTSQGASCNVCDRP